MHAAHGERETQAVTESLELYEALLLRAFAACEQICRSAPPRDPSAIRIWEVAQAFVACGAVECTTRGPRPSSGAAFEALDKLLVDWPQLAAGETTGEIAYAVVPDLWPRLMCEPPLGTYALLAADFIAARLEPGGKLVELGAGIGNTSRLLDLPANTRYIRTDKSIVLLNRPDMPGVPLRYDFDAPLAAAAAEQLAAADLVFAVNAMHCASHPQRTLARVREMLRPGGMLLLGEGESRPAGNRPWVLDMLCCQFSGWWDRTGFRPRSQWLADLDAAGFTDIGYRRLVAGEHDLGGLIWARA